MTERRLIVPGQGISLSEDVLKRLGKQVHERVVDLESDHARYFSDIENWWNWFEAKPRFAQKDFPFKNASNVVVPLIQVHTVTLVNRLLGMIFGDRAIWLHRTENEAYEKTARDVLRWINWAANGNDFDLRSPVTDWLTEMIAIGSSVLGVNWRNDIRYVVKGKRRGGLDAQRVNYYRGPLVEHIPRQQILWNTRYSVCDAPFVAREMHYFWSDINSIAAESAITGWIPENVEKIRRKEGLDGPGKGIRTAAQELDSITEDREPHDLREVVLDFPVMGQLSEGKELDNEDPGVPLGKVIVTYHYKTQTVLRVRAFPYNIPYNNYFDGFYRKRPGRSHGVGLCKDLYPMQDATTVLLNQGIDSRTRANSFWAKTNRRELISKPIDPRYPVYVPDGASFDPIAFDGNVLQDINLFNIVNILTERLTGQADPVMGRESRSGGHPSPATSTLALLGQSDQMIGALRMTVRGVVGRLGETIASLYQQFETNEDGKLQRTLGSVDAASVEQFLFPTDPIPGNIYFDVVGMSQSQNRQEEISNTIAVSQMYTNYATFVSNLAQLNIQARQQGMDAGPVILKFLQGQTKLQERLLGASNVDDTENYILSAAELAQLVGVAGQPGAAVPGAAAPGQPPMGGAMPAPSGGAPFTPGTLG